MHLWLLYSYKLLLAKSSNSKIKQWKNDGLSFLISVELKTFKKKRVIALENISLNVIVYWHEIILCLEMWIDFYTGTNKHAIAPSVFFLFPIEFWLLSIHYIISSPNTVPIVQQIPEFFVEKTKNEVLIQNKENYVGSYLLILILYL